MSKLQDFLDAELKKVNIDEFDGLDDYSLDYDIQDEIAKILVKARTDAGMTQSELSKITGISQANISKFENGVTIPSLMTLKKISDGLGKKLVVALADVEVM